MSRHIFHNRFNPFFLHVGLESNALAGPIAGISIMLLFIFLYRVCMCVTADHSSCT